MTRPQIAVIGAGPAGLMAAEALIGSRAAITVFDAMPSPGRKFLRAGIGGLNLTHSEPFPAFLARFGTAQAALAPMLAAFGPAELRDWAQGLGIDTFVGSSGRVFPVGMKAAPLLRAWLARLDAAGVTLRPRWTWQGWDGDGALRFDTPTGPARLQADAAILALGGGSWPRLGSTGAWTTILAAHGIALAPLVPANCGFACAWSEHFRHHQAGQPLKSVGLAFGERRLKGECVITANGIEGGAVYALSAVLRDAIAASGEAVLHIDLKPDWPHDKLARALAQPRGSRSLATHWQRSIGLGGSAAALARECLAPSSRLDAGALKAVPLRLTAPGPLTHAISTAGGIRFDQTDENLMLRARPGTFVAGEMLDWEAPTGGYLLTACMATGRVAGAGAARWIE